MSSTRQDAWTADEDLLLAEVILRHIREGGTQLQAFEEVGKKLSRTSAACGFRWNSCVRKQYKSGIEHAKKQRKEGKKQAQSVPVEQLEGQEKITGSQTENPAVNYPDFKTVITYLEKLYEQAGKTVSHAEEYAQSLSRIKELEKENGRLAKELAGLEEDYRSLMEILDRARKMVVDKDEGGPGQHKAKFQVDKFGNLERIE